VTDVTELTAQGLTNVTEPWPNRDRRDQRHDWPLLPVKVRPQFVAGA